jgi:hypothetical protein
VPHIFPDALSKSDDSSLTLSRWCGKVKKHAVKGFFP